MSQRTLYPIRESQILSRELWDRFAALAIQRDGSIAAAITRLIRRYVDEQTEPAAPHTD